MKKKVKKKALELKKRVSFNERFGLASRELILFVVLFIFSLVLYSVAEQEVWKNLFFLLMIVFGALGVGFLIVFLIFFFSKFVKK